MDENKITVSFGFTDAFGNTFSQQSTLSVFEEHDYSTLDEIGEQLNAFLRQCGYTRQHNHILMEPITAEEYDKLMDCLFALREKQDQSQRTITCVGGDCTMNIKPSHREEGDVCVL